MDTSAFSNFVLSLVTELMGGIAAAYIEQEERIIELLTEFSPNIEEEELRVKFTAELVETNDGLSADEKLSTEEMEIEVEKMIANHQLFGQRLLQQNFPKIIIDNGELKAKFMFGSDVNGDEGSEDSDSSPAFSEDITPETDETDGEYPSDAVKDRIEALRKSYGGKPIFGHKRFNALIKVPAYKKLVDDGVMPKAMITPVSSIQAGSENISSDLISEIRINFRTVYDG